MSVDDLPGYAVTGISIDDGSDDYYLAPDSDNDPLTLGSGGITATTSSTSPGGAEIGIPLVLDAPQSWSINGGGAQLGQVVLDDGLSATSTSADTLGVHFISSGVLGLSGDNEVGNVTATGSAGNPGINAFYNGAIGLAGADLNSSDGNSITLDDTGILGSGNVGPLTSHGGAIAPGDPTGSIAVDGSVSLDAASDFTSLIDGNGSTAGTDYSQLTATGNVNLGGSSLDVEPGSQSGACPTTLVPGTVYTLISTTGALTGTFDTPQYSIAGGPLTDGVYMDCTGSAKPLLFINYNTANSPNTVTATVAGPYIPTTTTLASDSTLGAQVTLTATVTADAGTPSGTVEFLYSSYSSPFSGTTNTVADCANVPLVQVGSAYQATCTATVPPAGASYRAMFVPASGTPLESSLSFGPGFPPGTISPPAPTPYAVGTVDHASTKGTAASVSLQCSGSPTTSCAFTIKLSITETLKDGKVIATTAKDTPKTKKRTVTIGSVTTTLLGGTSKTISVPLNSVGQSLLKHEHKLTMLCTATSATSTFYTQHLTFTTPHKTHSTRRANGKLSRTPDFVDRITNAR